MVLETQLAIMEASAHDRRIDPCLTERDMIAAPHDLYIAALESDATSLMKRLGFDDRLGRKRLADVISDLYITELMVIVQLVRWHEIGLVKPYELDVPHPEVLMGDLRQRIARSPREYVASDVLLRALGVMMAWWSENTVTTAWRSVKAHVQIDVPADGIVDAIADFLWDVRDALSATASCGDHERQVQL